MDLFQGLNHIVKLLARVNQIETKKLFPFEPFGLRVTHQIEKWRNSDDAEEGLNVNFTMDPNGSAMANKSSAVSRKLSSKSDQKGVRNNLLCQWLPYSFGVEPITRLR